MVPQVKAFPSCRSGRRLRATTGLSLLNHFTEPGAMTRPRPGGRLVTGVARHPVIFRASVLTLFPRLLVCPAVCARVRVCTPHPGVSSHGSRWAVGCAQRLRLRPQPEHAEGGVRIPGPPKLLPAPW